MLEISQIRCSLRHGSTEDGCRESGMRAAMQLLDCARGDISRVELYRKSIDARRKQDVHFTLTVRIELHDAADEERLLARVRQRDRRRVRPVADDAPVFPNPLAGGARPAHRPVVAGAGCAGLFAALTLAEAGLEPLLIEQGDDAARRTAAVEHFNLTGELDPASNIQFGLGGAGTFSDGKLGTGTRNPSHRLILRTFVDAGAPREILWDAKPHIGSDILPGVVTNLVARIEGLGGEVRLRTRLTGIERDGAGAIRAVEIECGGRTERIATDRLILACGHSARDVFGLLRDRGIALARKTFAMGARIEHAQADIDRALYGPAAGHPALGAAPYSLVAHLRNGRSVFSFCMCPGGQVVAAASEPGGVVTNGASLHARDGRNANAALLVNVGPEDLPGDDPLAGVELQRACEQAAFRLGGGGYRAPAQLLGDFLAGRPSTSGGRVEPSYPRGVSWGSIDPCLPPHIVETLRAGIPELARRLHGYDDPEAVLTAPETRSSSPVTIVRDRASSMAVGAPGLYPCGEGAGYAGGIMSAAADGIRCARAVIDSLTR